MRPDQIEEGFSPPRKDDGGPAFPWGSHGDVLGGMSLRDYFAAKALPALIAHYGGSESACVHANALQAYEYADAMLEARAK